MERDIKGERGRRGDRATCRETEIEGHTERDKEIEGHTETQGERDRDRGTCRDKGKERQR